MFPIFLCIICNSLKTNKYIYAISDKMSMIFNYIIIFFCLYLIVMSKIPTLNVLHFS